MAPPSFTNLIVTYNSRPDIGDLLEDLRRHAPGSGTILIDNASSDATAETVALHFPEVHLVTNELNIGYARAVNQGFDLARTEYVFLLNPDIRVGSSDVCERLQECLEAHPRAAVAAPLQFKEGRGRPRLNFTWSYWTPAAFTIYLAHLAHRPLRHIEPIRVAYLNAGCLFLRRSAFEAVGRLNEKYFLYGEEPDLFLKFRRGRFECWLLPEVSVVHTREQSLGTVPLLQRVRFKLLGALNIADAVLRGFALLLRDRLSGGRPK
jgi:GT2 family glycosyltransferase